MSARRLVKGRLLFVPPREQVRLLRQWNSEYDLSIPEEWFASLGKPPRHPDRPLCTVVLDVGLRTMWETLIRAWQIAAAQQDYAWRDSDLIRMCTVRMGPKINHLPGLRWRIVNLGANWFPDDSGNYYAPNSLQCPQDGPDAALLWAAAYFPKWIQRMDGREVPFVWIPGYRVQETGDDSSWCYIPRLYFYQADDGICLDADHQENSGPKWAVPELID